MPSEEGTGQEQPKVENTGVFTVPDKAEAKLAKKRPMTEAEFFTRADELVAEANESGLDYMGLLLSKYGLRKVGSWIEGRLEHGFSRNRGK